MAAHDKDGSSLADADESPVEEKYLEADEDSKSDEFDVAAGGLRRLDTRVEEIPMTERQELKRLASSLRGTSYIVNTRTKSNLERKDTIAELEVDDPVLNPESDQFDSYKWARMALRLFDEAGVKLRRAGVSFKDLNVSGTGSALQLQKNVGSVLMAPLRVGDLLRKRTPEKQILRNFDGILKSGEMLIVLGRPGSGCSTLLKTLCGELKGLNFQDGSEVHYNGISMETMHKQFKGEVVYNQEVDKHFPHLTVGETLEFASAARAPHIRPMGISRKEYYQHMAKVIMSVLGLSHTYNTKVGNDYVRGVSGGERKRVSIAEMALAAAPIGAWDNSTRGLDAATALEFVKSLRMFADLAGVCHLVAIYQASQAIYDVFDKAVVLYEGREIYFGPCDQAERYFTEMGWYNPPRQTTGDFLTSVTNPSERKAREGFENKVPRTPDEFEKYWRNSPEFAALQKEIEEHRQDFPSSGQAQRDFHESKVQEQAKHVRPESPYMISIPMQIRLCTKRAYQRLWNDKTSTVTTLISQVVMALIIGSIFYGTPDATSGFFGKGAVLFFAVLLNALMSINEINSLYDQRPIVEKQASYAFYHPFAEAFGGIVSDIPMKFLAATVFNIILYFLAGLRREPSQFFIYFLFMFVAILTMSAVFRTLAASTKTLPQAMALAGVMVLAIVIYSGFLITIPNMHPWFSWIRYLNPVFFAFEALLSNEFHGRQFTCSEYVPAYPNLVGDQFICSSVGAVTGQRFVSGDDFLHVNYRYSYTHTWRNLGILFAFMIGFYVIYLTATELNSSSSSTAEFLVFRRGKVPSYLKDIDKQQANGEPAEKPAGAEKGDSGEQNVNAIPAQKDVFTWRNVVYDIPIQGGQRRLLDNVSGWVKPGTLTALMGVSGAGKTTLLDVLAQRVSLGVVTGDMLVNGKELDPSFQRKTGYVQQQDLHLHTTTVREALQFSATLRQPKSVSKQEKYDYVEEVIKMLAMEDFAEAVVGTPGEGLNVEQRKLLTIGVELAAKPALLLFLDEPTSGLDSQSSWAICAFLRKLADNGQAVLCTIHQPSAVLFQEFDRLLFLAKGGKTVYFGDIGKQSRTLLDYFEGNGARHCNDTENPAEYMLEIIGAGATGKSTTDWPAVWKESQEAKGVQTELDRIHEEKSNEPVAGDEGAGSGEFAMPFTSQLWNVTYRVFQQYWRMPSYIYAKILLVTASSLFIGFSFFDADSSQAGLQNILFSIFMLTSIFSTLVEQIIPQFVTQRSLYEVRERPSKAYSWAAFVIANITVEIPYQILIGIIAWASFYYPVFGASQSGERQGLMLLFTIQFFIFTSTIAQFIIAALPDAETAGNIATLIFSLTLVFNGVMVSPTALPGFWIFMYRVSPLTYLVAGMTATGLHQRAVHCSQPELSIFNAPPNTSCGDYLAQYLQAAPGYLLDPSSTGTCEYCPLTVADQYLAGSNIFWSERWRNWGIGWAFIGFNVFAAVALYYIFRVRHWNPTSIVRRICQFGKFVGQMFKTRTGETPKGKEARNGRIF